VRVVERDRRLLVSSSLSFLVPASYALGQGLFLYATTSIVTTLVSIAYWHHPIVGLRRTLDLCVAKLSFVIFFVSGYATIKTAPLLPTGLVGCAAILASYHMSNTLWSRGSSSWVYFHALFHFCVAGEQGLVLYGLVLWRDNNPDADVGLLRLVSKLVTPFVH